MTHLPACRQKYWPVAVHSGGGSMRLHGRLYHIGGGRALQLLCLGHGGGGSDFLSMAAFLPLYQAWMLRRRQPAEVKETVYTFKERTFSVESVAGEHEYAYASLVQVYESEGYFFLMMSKKSALVLPKRSFVSGTPKGMREFLEQKTDGKVVRLSL